MNLFIVPQST